MYGVYIIHNDQLRVGVKVTIKDVQPLSALQ